MTYTMIKKTLDMSISSTPTTKRVEDQQCWVSQSALTKRKRKLSGRKKVQEKVGTSNKKNHSSERTTDAEWSTHVWFNAHHCPCLASKRS